MNVDPNIILHNQANQAAELTKELLRRSEQVVTGQWPSTGHTEKQTLTVAVLQAMTVSFHALEAARIAATAN